MVQKKTLDYSEIRAFLLTSQQERPPVVGSVKTNGKWQLLELTLDSNSDDSIDFICKTSCEHFKQDQPIGICVHLGHFKYLFDTVILEIDTQSLPGRITVSLPDNVERVGRRAYHRQAVPDDTKVKVMFWHRGYMDNSDLIPEEDYWQGVLLNLSAGGARFEIEIEHKENFKVGQVLGIQFTPMSYQKPILLESHIKYTEEQSDQRHFRIGVEFLGLEASPEGRQILERILEVINQYKEMSESVLS